MKTIEDTRNAQAASDAIRAKIRANNEAYLDTRIAGDYEEAKRLDLAQENLYLDLWLADFHLNVCKSVAPDPPVKAWDQAKPIYRTNTANDEPALNPFGANIDRADGRG